MKKSFAILMLATPVVASPLPNAEPEVAAANYGTLADERPRLRARGVISTLPSSRNQESTANMASTAIIEHTVDSAGADAYMNALLDLAFAIKAKRETG